MSNIYKISKPWISIWIRTGPGLSYNKKSVIYGKDNKEYEVTDIKNDHWLKIQNIGWCCDIDSDGNKVMELVKEDNANNGIALLANSSSKAKANNNNKKTSTTTKSKTETKGKEKQTEESYAYVPDYDVITSDSSAFTSSLESNFTISNLQGVFGMPYQFLSSADPRVTDSSSDGIGRKYAKEIISHMPLLLMTPGKPVFMSKYSKDDKKSILGKFISVASGTEKGIQDTVLNDKGFGKYYSLEYAYNEYFQYVNPMCRVAARIMNVHDVSVNGTSLDSYNWAQNTNSNFNKLFSVYKGCTAWYCESENNISDSFSNSTSESILSSKINSLSDFGRELNFILGTVKAGTGIALDKFVNTDSLSENMEKVNEMMDTALGDNKISGVFKSITNAAQTVAAGGRIVFPEIWSDSSFSRSYSISLKLVSPDGDDLSIYLNIIVPMLHLLGLVLPKQAPDTIDGFASYGYVSPFLVRAFYKGFFNVDMGIITDLNFSKGKESAWSSSGVPTVVDVSLTIKDLYSDIYMTNMDGKKNNLLKNIILMDYISNMCGVNINEVDVYRGIDLFLMQNVKNRITDTWHMKIWGSLDQWVSNKYQNLFGKF